MPLQDLPEEIRELTAARMVRAILPAASIALLLNFLVIALVMADEPHRLLSSSLATLLLLPAWRAFLHRRYRRAAQLLVAAVVAAVLGGMLVSGGVHAPVTLGLIPTVAVYTAVFGYRAGGRFLVASLLVLAAFVVAEILGWIQPPPPPDPVFLWTVKGSWIVLSFLFITIPISLMNRALCQSEQRREEAEAANLRAATVFQQSSHLLGLLSPDGILLAANATALRFAGLEESGVIGRPFAETPWWPEDTRDELRARIAEAATGRPVTFRTRHVDRRGDERVVDFTLGPGLDRQGEVAHIIAEGRDVTDIVAAEEKLLQQQRLDSIGALAGGIAHDFNNMLSGIIGAADLLKDEIDPQNERLTSSLRVIETAASRAAELTSSLLTFSREEGPLQQPVDLHGAITDALSILTRSVDKRIIVSSELGASHATVLGDPSQIVNLVLNLGINACDAMREGGELTIATVDRTITAADADEELAAGDYIELRVADQGSGIAPEHLARIFEPFFTTKGAGEGTGLGLATVYGTVRAHGGRIGVESTVGEGTTFTILLPVGETTIASIPAAQVTATRGVGSILLVDDEELVRDMAERMLKRLGYGVITAADGHEAIEMFEQARQVVVIDLVVLDMVMPRCNGVQTYHAIRAIDADVPIVVASGYADSAEIRELKDAGLRHIIGKPYRRDQLAQVVSEAIGTPADRHGGDSGGSQVPEEPSHGRGKAPPVDARRLT